MILQTTIFNKEMLYKTHIFFGGNCEKIVFAKLSTEELPDQSECTVDKLVLYDSLKMEFLREASSSREILRFSLSLYRNASIK